MINVEIMKRKKIDVVDSLLLHKELHIKSNHRDWIARRIDNYQFEEGVDYFRSKKSEIKTVGRPSKSYLLTLDMCKELSMLENNDIGKSTRKYFIKCEKELRKTETIRLAGIETRKSLTDTIQESGEQERMHGRGYSNYTRLVYEVTGLTPVFELYKGSMKARGLKGGNFRETLMPKELKQVELAESIIKPLLELDQQYSDIKKTLEPLFERKEIK